MRRLAVLMVRYLGDKVLRRSGFADRRRRPVPATTFAAVYVALTQLQADALVALGEDVRDLAAGRVALRPVRRRLCPPRLTGGLIRWTPCRPVRNLARLMAILGGIVLTLLVVLTCVSVLGRGLNTLGHCGLLEGARRRSRAWLIGTGVGPVAGDFELVEAGIAFAIFAFLPGRQLHGGHATVDVFTDRLPARGAAAGSWPSGRSCCAAGDPAHRLAALCRDDRQDAATARPRSCCSSRSGGPMRRAFAAALAAAIVALYCAAARVVEAVTGREPHAAVRGGRALSTLELGFWSFPVLLLLIFLRAPIGLAMLLCGIGGLWLAIGSAAMFLAKLKTETYSTFSSYSLSIIPMFLLMGQFATLSGMSPGAVQGRRELARPPPGRRRDGGGRRLRRLRRDLRLVARDRRHDGPGRPAGDCGATAIRAASRPRRSPPAARSAS